MGKPLAKWEQLYELVDCKLFAAEVQSINKDLKLISADDSLVVFMLSVNCESLSMTNDRSGYSGFLHQ